MVIWIIFIVVRLVFYVLVLQTMKPNIENEKKKDFLFKRNSISIYLKTLLVLSGRET